MTTINVDTPHGQARAHLHPAGDAKAALVPAAAERRTVVEVEGDHSLRTDLEAVAAAVQAWLSQLVFASG